MGVTVNITVADRIASEAASIGILEDAELEKRRNGAVLAEVRSVVNDEVFCAIVSEIEDSSHVFDFKISDASVGRPQDDGAAWGLTYVYQSRNGGITGDDFAGTVSIPIGNGKFFSFGYAM